MQSNGRYIILLGSFTNALVTAIWFSKPPEGTTGLVVWLFVLAAITGAIFLDGAQYYAITMSGKTGFAFSTAIMLLGAVIAVATYQSDANVAAAFIHAGWPVLIWIYVLAQRKDNQAYQPVNKAKVELQLVQQQVSDAQQQLALVQRQCSEVQRECSASEARCSDHAALVQQAAARAQQVVDMIEKRSFPSVRAVSAALAISQRQAKKMLEALLEVE